MHMWYEYFYAWRKQLIGFFILATLVSAYFIPRLNYNFAFEQFFPQGDPDLEYFKKFIDEFESDDNFLLIAIKNQPDVFEPDFLKRVKSFSLDCRRIPNVRQVQSIPIIKNPVKTPFGLTTIPLVHPDDPKQLERDRQKIINDERFVYNLITPSANSTVVFIKTDDGIQINASKELMTEVNSLLSKYELNDHHMLGRPYFQKELSEMQLLEIARSTVISSVLILIILITIYRRWWSVIISLTTIGIGLVIFLGILRMLGRELSLMAALYPVLMLIVGTSDVVHIMTKYFDELKKGRANKEAMEKTIKQIGLATLLTSLTTAVGFASLLSSKIAPIQDFGLNSAMGVVLAYIVVIGFTCPLLSLMAKEKLIPVERKKERWGAYVHKLYIWGLNNQRRVIAFFTLFTAFAIWGMSMVHTNYQIEDNLPRGAKITEDFHYFESEYAGFRPLEVAVTIQDTHNIYSHEVLSSINALHNHIISRPEILTCFSLATVVKTINKMNNANRESAYLFPEEDAYRKIERELKKERIPDMNGLVNQDKRLTRISAKIKDVGAENIRVMTAEIDDWIDQNIDPSIVTVKQTGTGIILDKNSEFVRESLLAGLSLALILVSILMAMLFRNAKVALIALVPNILPLLIAAALLGFFNIPLEAGISIVFAIIFGIAVDDTIHFLSKYKLAKDYLQDREEAIRIAFKEAGRAIIFTSIILFFGFLVLLFSIHPPSVTIGILIAITLLSAVITDLTVLPALIRIFKI